MATETSYNFTLTQVDTQALICQIRASSISTAVDYINTDGTTVSIYFKDVLSDTDSATLTALVSAYAYVAPVITYNPINVTTQFESNKYTLKLASISGLVQSDGSVTLLFKIPGTPGGTDGRYINAAEAFFDVATAGDRILGAWFVDHDNILGNGVDYVVGSYTDDVAPSANQGWFLPSNRGFVRAETIGFYGFAPSGFYIKIMAQKAAGITTGTLYVNFEWGISGAGP